MGTGLSVNRGSSMRRSGHEVHKWREDGLGTWNETACQELQNEIKRYVTALVPLKQIDIIVCGGTAHGKSSLINNCVAALSGIYSQTSQVDRGEQQVTLENNRCQTWEMDDGSVKTPKLNFFDTRGFSGDSMQYGVTVEAIKACILGNVKSGEPLGMADEFWQKRATGEKVSYIFFVADATTIPEQYQAPKEMKSIYQTLRQISMFAKTESIPVAALMTKCDVLDLSVKENISNMHYSAKVERKVKVLCRMVDILGNRVYPVVNYTDQTRATAEIRIQTLIALKACLEDILCVRIHDIYTRCITAEDPTQ